MNQPQNDVANSDSVSDESDSVGGTEPESVVETSSDLVGPQEVSHTHSSAVAWLGKSLVQAGILAAVFVIGIVMVGVAQRAGWIQAGGKMSDDASAHSSHDGETIYTCPMHPQIRQNEPGSCPICAMQLVTAISGGVGDGLSVNIEPVARRLVGIQTATAKMGPVSQTIRTIGSISYDESKLATISAYVGGRIEKLFANYVGVPVGENDDLALIYSPDLYSAQVEYLTALKGGGLKRLGGAGDLPELAKQNLIELGLTEDQVSELRSRGDAESRMRLRSPITGTVINKFAVEGDYIKTGEKIYRIADLSTVWLMLDLYPDDAARIRFGQQIEAEVNSIPDRAFTGRVAFIDPTVNATTRTVRVRVEMLNPDGLLKPGDYATARVYVPAIRQDRLYDPNLANKFISPMHPQIIRGNPGDCPVCGMDLIPTSDLGYANEPLPDQQVVSLPRDAVLVTGNNSVVYVETDPGRFEIRRVAVGPMTDDRAVILEGVSPGETVATNGNFLIDSQMQLAGNPSLMDPSKALTYSPGPLELSKGDPVMLAAVAAEQFDRAYQTYFTIQRALASDQMPSPEAVNTLDDALGQLVMMPGVPNEAQSHMQRARRSLRRMSGSIGETRKAFRPLSHALLKTASLVRGQTTADNLMHFYCPMVPGGGGDWMQPDGELINPYWGSKMYSCGELVSTMGVEARGTDE